MKMYAVVLSNLCSDVQVMDVFMCGSPRLLLGIFLSHSSLYSLRRGLSVEPVAHTLGKDS